MSIARSVFATGIGGVSMALIISAGLKAAVTPVPAPEFIPMTAPSISLIQPDGAPAPVLAEKTFALQAGETRRVFGRVEIVSSTTDSKYVETYTQCALQDGTMYQHAGAAQNHEGSDTPPGVNYPLQGHLVLYPLLLFTAPVAGTYQCWLSGTSGKDNLSAVATDFEGTSTTWLQVSATNEAGESWWWQDGFCDEWGNTGPGPDGYSSCVYLAGASNLQQLNVFDNDGSPANSWVAADDAAFVSANDSLMLTTCYYGTNSCTGSNSESWWTHFWDDPGGTEVDSHLELIQLDPAGGVCNLTQSPEQTSWVGNAPHHYMIYHSLTDVPVYPCGGSRQFKLRISVKYVSGNPVKEDGYLWTHAYAFTSYKGTAPPVPNVIGLTEAAAGSYLTATGYTVATVSSSLNAAPAGTVISQFPSAGTIELPGSGVNLTVSAGGVIVPNLLSSSQSSATSAIRALGLVPSVSSQKACINPGDVLTQSPLAGTLVASGSTVNITIDSGTRQTCVLK